MCFYDDMSVLDVCHCISKETDYDWYDRSSWPSQGFHTQNKVPFEETTAVVYRG